MMQKIKSKVKDKDRKGELSSALKSFLGYLEGTEKSLHTHASYRLDIEDFFNFLEKNGDPISKFKLNEITIKKIDFYHNALKKDGQKSNTRRRKLMTLRKWFQYLKKRKKIDSDIGKLLPVPEKNERVPLIYPYESIYDQVLKMPEDSDFYLRNKVLFFFLLHSGASVTELSKLKKSQVIFSHDKEFITLQFLNKSEREVKLPLSAVERSLVERLVSDLKNEDAIFCSFNRHGKLYTTSITSRGVEMLVSGKGKEWGLELTPRTIRHSVVVEWFRSGVDRPEIQRRLGLSTNYSLQIYEPHFKKIENKS